MSFTTKMIVGIGAIVALLASILLFFKNKKENERFLYIMEPAPLYGVLHITSPVLTSRQMLEGILCVENVSDVSKIDLFMPDMGHGSQPPVVARSYGIPSEFLAGSQGKKDFGCYKVSQMQLYMSGLWQVRVLYKNKTMGTFSVQLEDTP
jgi:hypothetical protein